MIRLDICDIKELFAISDDADVRIVFQNLLKGSCNHLRSFTGQLERYNSDYNPQYLTYKEFEKILSENSERGDFQ